MGERLDIGGLSFARLPSKTLRSSDSILRQVKQVERRTFPPNEAFDFDNELRKKTTNLHCAYRTVGGDVELVAYALYVRSKFMTRIHKVCVVERYRNQGLGKWLMGLVLAELTKGSATTIDLWVDVNRKPARELYLSCGFEEKELVPGYYSLERDGIRMEMDLDKCKRP